MEVEGERSRLKQVVVNLLDNAIKYTPHHGSVGIAIRAQNGAATIEVDDTGPGISGAPLPHVLERFYRVHEIHSSDAGGAGLGLSIVQAICAAHGGEIAIMNRAGGGCCVTAAAAKGAAHHQF